MFKIKMTRDEIANARPDVLPKTIAYPLLGDNLYFTGDLEGHMEQISLIEYDSLIERTAVSFGAYRTHLEATKSESPTWQEELSKMSIHVKELSKSDGGGGKNYYDLPPNPTQLLDLIEYRNMNGNIKDIFKACYRLGQKDGISEEYDLRKMALYSLRELGRVTGRKDYLVLADEVIGYHDITGAEVITK